MMENWWIFAMVAVTAVAVCLGLSIGYASGRGNPRETAHVHDWGEWQVTGRVPVGQGWGKRVVGICVFQQRQCKTCKFLETNHQVDNINAQ